MQLSGAGFCELDAELAERQFLRRKEAPTSHEGSTTDGICCGKEGQLPANPSQNWEPRFAENHLQN